MLSVDLKDDRSEIVHYDFESYPIYIRRALLSQYNNFEAQPHWHDDIEFTVILEGEMSYNVNGEIITMRKGEGVFVNSRQLHHGFSKSKSECDFVCILLHPLLLCVSQTLEKEFIVPVLKNRTLPYIKLTFDVPWKKELLSCLLNMYDIKDEPTAPMKTASLFLKIWSIIFESSKPSATVKGQSGDFTVLKNMIGFIQKSYREKLTLADIASSGAVGQSKCCKLFDRFIGVTPNEYLIRYRLNQSVWYLKNTDMTVTEIAQSVGFSGSSYFAEAFGKRYGESPSEFRKEKSFKPKDSHQSF